jgi:hypothetical protein
MGRRVARALARAGVQADPIARVGVALELAMARRIERIQDDHDPRFLHPARTILVLVEDVGLLAPGPLVVAPLLDSVDPGLSASDEAVLGALGPETEEARRGLPRLPGGLLGPASGDEEDAWFRAMSALEPVWLATMLAEALDHARHLHLLPSSEGRGLGAARVGRFMIPLASRCGAGMEGADVLERRFGWWWRRVGRRLAEGGPGPDSEG